MEKLLCTVRHSVRNYDLDVSGNGPGVVCPLSHWDTELFHRRDGKGGRKRPRHRGVGHVGAGRRRGAPSPLVRCTEGTYALFQGGYILFCF